MTNLHHSPSLQLEVQRSLEQSDSNLEVQRQEFLTEARAQEENSSLSERIANELNAGVPLEENIRKQLEAHFNTDLSKVRIHTNGKAHELAKSANATAFTTGNNIFFQSGKYDPNSSVGFELLAHETAHTIQQALGQVSPGIDSSPSLESEAKLEGRKAVGNKGNLEKQATNFNDFILKPKLENQPTITPRAAQRFRATHASARAIQRQADQNAIETPVAKTAFVREEGLNLRSKPDQKSSSNGTFPVGTRVFVISKTGEWLKVLVNGAKTGYMLASKIHGLSPEHQAMLQKDPGLRLFRVKNLETGWGLVGRAYGIKGNESTKDQGVYHFLNAIRKINNPSMFKIVIQGGGVQKAASKAKNWLGEFFGSGLDADNVQLQQGDLWIPSFQAAAKMDVGSGNIGGEFARVEKKVQQRIDDFKKACQLSEQFIPKAVLAQVGNSAKGLVTGLVDFAVKAAAIIAVSTAAGALIGAFFGGVGAAPGAALGFEIGLQIVELYGLAMLVQWLAQSLKGIGGAFGSFINQVWDANGDEAKLKLAAQTLADAIAKLVGFLLEALAAYVIAKGTQAVMKTKFAETVGKTQLGKWAGERIQNQQARRNNAANKVVDKIKNPTTPKAGTKSGRVRSPVQGLYDSVDVNTPPKGWRFQDALVENKTTGIKNLITEVTGPKNEAGVFERAYNPATQQLELKNAFLQNLPKWVNDAGVPLVNGKGTPTVTYMTIYQMRKLGVNSGELKTVKMSTIQNIEAILQLESLVRKGLPRDEAVLQTHSVQYADTPIIQSGHEIVSAKVETKGAWFDKTIDYLMKHYENGNPVKISYHDGLLKKYGLQRTDKVLMNYDIYLKVQPLKPGSIAKPIGGN